MQIDFRNFFPRHIYVCLKQINNNLSLIPVDVLVDRVTILWECYVMYVTL